MAKSHRTIWENIFVLNKEIIWSITFFFYFIVCIIMKSGETESEMLF